MPHMIELYEMISVNDAALRGTEKLEILKARLVLQMFERVMQNFKAEISPNAGCGSEGCSMIKRLIVWGNQSWLWPPL